MSDQRCQQCASLTTQERGVLAGTACGYCGRVISRLDTPAPAVAMTRQEWYRLAMDAYFDTTSYDTAHYAAIDAILARMAELIEALPSPERYNGFRGDNAEMGGYEAAKRDMLALLRVES